MKLPTSMLLAVVFVGAVHGQTAAPPPAAASGAANGTKSGSAPTRATGLPPTAPGLTGTSPAYQPLGNANGNSSGDPATPATNSGRTANANGRGTGAGAATGGNTAGVNNGGGANGSGPQSPAPAATGNVEVTGSPAQNRTGTADRPLLPIVSAGNGLGIRSGTPINVKLRVPIDSGHARNGDMVDATLTAPVGSMPAGTPVRLTVVQAAPAGRLASYGELSVQVVSIADHRVLSDTITAQGKEGPKELPDAAPARGTEAVFTPDQPITLPAS